MLSSARSGECIVIERAGLEGKHCYPRDGLTRVTSLRRAGLEDQSCCPRHVQVSAFSLRHAGLRASTATLEMVYLG